MQVNRFNMPLLNITGVNALHENFNVAFGLSGKEEEGDFTWLLENMDTLRRDPDYNIDKPSVILSDFCKGFKKAARVVFTGVPQQLCVWHIMKNVNHHVNKKWVPATVANSLIEAPIPDENAAPDLDGPGPEPPSYRPNNPDDDDDDDDADEPHSDPQEVEDSAAADRLTNVPDGNQHSGKFHRFR
jgi:hypothetical protein